MKWTRKRADMLVRLGPRSRVNADDPGLDGTALKELKGGFYSATARKSTAARLDWWIKRAARRGREPFPIDLEALTLAGALLKAGRYRSSQQYLYTIRKEHVARGHVWDVALESAFKDIRRSCERGLGGPKQAGALSLDEMRSKGTYEGVVLAEASLAIVFGSWWLLREIELAALTVGQVSFEKGAGCGVSEGISRLFGRWASTAMFKYTREALLGKQGLLVAKQVEAAGEPQPAAAGSTCTLTATAKRKWGQALRSTRAQ